MYVHVCTTCEGRDEAMASRGVIFRGRIGLLKRSTVSGYFLVSKIWALDAMASSLPSCSTKGWDTKLPTTKVPGNYRDL